MNEQEVVVRLAMIGRYADHLKAGKVTPQEALELAAEMLRQAKEHAA